MFVLYFFLHSAVVFSQGPISLEDCQTGRTAAAATLIAIAADPDHPGYANAQNMRAECHPFLVS